VTWTAPAQPGTHTLAISGNLKLQFRRETPGGVTEADGESGALSRSIEIVVQGGAPVPTPLPTPAPAPVPATPRVNQAAAPMTPEQALQHTLNRFNALGSRPVEGSYPTYVAPERFWSSACEDRALNEFAWNAVTGRLAMRSFIPRQGQAMGRV